MARRKKNRKLAHSNQYVKQQNETNLLRHIARLELRSIEAYKIWCALHGFSKSLEKTHIQRERERQKHAQLVSMQRLRQHSQESKLRTKIVEISHGELNSSELSCDVLVEIANSFKRCKAPEVLLESLLYLERCSKLLSDVQYIRGVTALVSHHSSWLHPLHQWKPQKHGARRQFSSLTRYLLAKYEVPLFMDEVWFSNKRSHHAWFIHIGAGENIRAAKALPIALTKKMAHHYVQAPAHYGVLAAFRWAQVRSLGGELSLCDAIAATQLSRRFKDEAFWLSVIRFFVNNPTMDHVHVHPIVDYIWNQKYEDRHDYDANGTLENRGPAQANFTMRGRTQHSLLAQVEAWHRSLGRATPRIEESRWARWMTEDYKFIEGCESSGNRRIWFIRELLSSGELYAEGRSLKHCVGTYASACASGQSAIYSLDLQDQTGLRKLLTIEVHRKHRVVAQVRGKRNRSPTPVESQVVQRWALKNNLR